MSSFFRRALIFGAAVLLLPRLMSLFLPFIIGFLIYIMCRGSVRRLAKLGLGRTFSSAATLLFAAIIFAAALSAVFAAIYDKSEQIPVLYREISALNVENETLQKLLSVFKDELATLLKELSVKLLSCLGDLGGAVMTILFAFISAFFFLKDEEKLISVIADNGGARLIERAEEIRRVVSGALGGYIRAQAIIMSIMFVVLSIFFVLFGIKNALLIALGTAFADALPVFGTGIILLPWAAYQILVADRALGFGLIALWGVCSLLRQIIEPKILSFQIGLHPLLTLFAIFVGFKLFGICGLILGPTATFVFVTYIQKLY